MLSHDQAQELVFCQLALDLRHHSPGDLIEGEIEREWGWLFLYPNFSGGLPCGWLVNRHSGLMKHLPAVTSADEAVAEYEETLRRPTPDSGGTPG